MKFFKKTKNKLSDENSSKSKIEEQDLNKKYESIYENINSGKVSNYNINLQMFNEVKKWNIFDSKYYKDNYVPFLSIEYTLLHYLNEGYKYGHNPNNKFNNDKYIELFNIEKLELNPLVHYILLNEQKSIEFDDLMQNFKYENILKDIENGKISDYNPNLKYYDKLKDCELFDDEFYISTYNLPISKEFALIHFLNEGYELGFNPSEDFSCNEYLKNNTDVKKAGINPFAHYVLHGMKEGREFPLSDYKKLEMKFNSVETEIQINRVLQNVELLKQKVSGNNRINLIFILPAMVFAYKELYKLFNEDELFNVNIILVPHRIGNNENITNVAKEKYYQIFNLLKEKNYNVIDGYDFDNNQGIDLVNICNPDIIFYILPYMRIYPENMRIENLPSNIIYAYIPYGEFIGDLDNNNFNFGWNEKIWKIFSNVLYKKVASKKSVIGSSNVVQVGSPRMDSLINYEPSEHDYTWIYPKEENKKRIIWAPHHTLPRPNMSMDVVFSTFDKNYEFFYEYAKNNPDIEWVLRPHPILKEVLDNVNTYMKIEGKVNKNFVEDYFFKWESLPNASVHEELDYFDLFANADAMITDCVSFKGEYLFAKKPGLILKSESFNSDELIYDAWYTAYGNDFDEISKFIEDVVVNENDYLKDKREEIFDYYFNFNLGTASKCVYNFIKDEFKRT